MKTILETAVGNPDYSTLVAAVKTAGLEATLSGTGPLTVFAPTNAAFAKIPEATLKAVLADPKKLTGILTYHVLPKKVLAADLAHMASVTTVQGGALTVDTKSGVRINTATVTASDLECTNGVIHTIDSVLMP